MPETNHPTPNFAEMLKQATTDPGTVSAAYTVFHNYSLGNQWLAACQLTERGLPLAPIASFNRWKELGRHVTKGQKALELCMPVTRKRTEQTADGTEETHAWTAFIYRRNWFSLSQTEGAEYVPDAPPAWDRSRALAALDVTEVPFEHLDGNCQGFARRREIAVSPIAAHPLKTTFHELAHVIIGHTAETDMTDSDRTPRDIREVEAEATAMLCCAALQLPGLEQSRGYIQHWYGSGQPIPEASARRITKAADAILKAGKPAADEKE